MDVARPDEPDGFRWGSWDVPLRTLPNGSLRVSSTPRDWTPIASLVNGELDGATTDLRRTLAKGEAWHSQFGFVEPVQPEDRERAELAWLERSGGKGGELLAARIMISDEVDYVSREALLALFDHLREPSAAPAPDLEELSAALVAEPDSLDALRALHEHAPLDRLVGVGPASRSVAAAVNDLRAYANSPERARYVPELPPLAPFGDYVSLAWFLAPPPVPDSEPEWVWLGFYEALLRESELGSNRGEGFYKRGGTWFVLRWRYEVEGRPSLVFGGRRDA